MPESKPKATISRAFQTEADVVDEVFLTPRVLDQGAFREYADSLKNLIREANGKRTDLRTDADDARQLCESLTTTAARLRERLETTAKLLPTLDDRVKRAERLLEVAADKSKLPQKIEEILRAGVEAMQKRVDDVLSNAEERLAQIEARFERVRQASEQSAGALEGLRNRLDEASSVAAAGLDRMEAAARTIEQQSSQHAAEAGARLHEHLGEIARQAADACAAADAHVETLTSQLDERVAHARRQAADAAEAIAADLNKKLTDATTQASASVQSICTQASDAVTENEERARQLQQQLVPLAQVADEVREALEAQVAQATKALDEATAETVKKIHAVELITKRTIRLLGFDPNKPGDEVAPDSLMMLVQRGDEMERQARDTAIELNQLHQLAEDVLTELRACVMRSAETVEDYKRRGLEMILNLERSIAPLCDQNGALLEQILAARDLLADLDQQKDGVMEDISQFQGRAFTELLTLRERATNELKTIASSIAEQRGALDQLRSAMREPDSA